MIKLVPTIQPMLEGLSNKCSQIWLGFFFELGRLFGGNSYYQISLSPTITGQTGNASVTGELNNDRNFSWINLEITPNGAISGNSITLSNLQIAPKYRTLLAVTQINPTPGVLGVTLGECLLNLDGTITLPPIFDVSVPIMISGSFVNTFQIYVKK